MRRLTLYVVSFRTRREKWARKKSKFPKCTTLQREHLKELIRKLRKVIVITEITSRTSYKCLMKFIRKVSRLCISVTRKIQILTVRLFRQREVLYLINLIKNFTRSFSLQQKNFKRVVTDIFTYTICRQDVIQ